MGAVPSRESLRRSGICQLPTYGQRHQMVLVPLTKEFFPSPSCSLLLQLLEARRDPFVRYYHSYEENLRRVEQGGGTEEAACAITEDAWRADALPAFDCSSEEFYEAYICRAGESLLFDTDEEMLEAYARKPRSLRPLPCAVAFVYNRESGAAQCAHEDRHETKALEPIRSGKDCGKNDATPPEEDLTQPSTVCESRLPGDDVELCGLHLRAIGFIGDVSALQLKLQECRADEGDYQLQMFLNKSVGDHNYMHVLLTALYTYAVQWREALVVRRMAACGVHPRTGEVHDLEEHFISCDAANWPMPPLRSVIISNRRTNVPMLCFLRNVRAVIVGMDLVMESDDGGSCGVDEVGGEGASEDDATRHTSDVKAQLATEATPANKRRVEESNALDLERDVIAKEEFMTMWLKDGLIFVHVPEYVLARAVRYVVQCIYLHKHPLDILHTKSCQKAPCSEEYPLSLQRPTPVSTEAATDAASSTVAEVESLKAVGISGDRLPKSTRCMGIAAPRLLDESVVVEEWPEKGMDLISIDSITNTNGTTHFYWVVGDSVAARRSAAAAISAWESSGRSVKVDLSGAQDPFKTSGDVTVPMMSVGELLHFVVFPSSEESEECSMRALSLVRRGCIPLEELLLAELQNACRWAREADVNVANWVRYGEGAKQRASVRIMPANQAADGGALQTMADAVSQLVGEGSLCLWRVPLGTGAMRVIAVAPHFLRSTRHRKQRRRPAHHQWAGGRRAAAGAAKEATLARGMVHSEVHETHTTFEERSGRKPPPSSEVLLESEVLTPTTACSVQAVSPTTGALRPHSSSDCLFQKPKPLPHHHHHSYHACSISDGFHEAFYLSCLGVGTSPNVFPCSKGTREDHYEPKIFDDTMDSHFKHGCAFGSGFSSTVYSAAHMWDDNGAWGIHNMVSDEVRSCAPSCHTGVGGTAQPLLPFHSTLAPPRTCVFDHPQNGPSWLTDQQVASMGCYCCSESGRVSPAVRFQDPQPLLLSSGDGSQMGREEFSNTGIQVTVRHGLPHYRTPSSLNYSDTASSHETTTTKQTSRASERQSSQTGAYRWDWKKSGPHDDWEDL